MRPRLKTTCPVCRANRAAAAKRQAKYIRTTKPKATK